MQAVYITSKVVSSIPTHGEIQLYVITFVSDLLYLWFSIGNPVSSTNKTDHHDITEILLKVALRAYPLKVILETASCALN